MSGSLCGGNFKVLIGR